MSSSFMSKLTVVATSLSLGLLALASPASADVAWLVQPSSTLSGTASVTLQAIPITYQSDDDGNTIYYDANGNPVPVDGNGNPVAGTSPHQIPTPGPGQPGYNPATYAPPITLSSIPQTDPGTSGDPTLAHPVNSLITSGTGYFMTTGPAGQTNNFLSNIDFGAKPTLTNNTDGSLNMSPLTVVANNSGLWLPNQNQTAPDGTPANNSVSGGLGTNVPVQAYGPAVLANTAAELIRTSPTSGPDNYGGTFGYTDFSQAPTDVGRLAVFGLQAVPIHTTTTVTNPDNTTTTTVNKIAVDAQGHFSATNMQFLGGFGVAANITEKSIDPSSTYPQGVNLTTYPPFVFTSATINGTTDQTLTGAASMGSIVRIGAVDSHGVPIPNQGPQYQMTVPYSAGTGLGTLQFNLNINMVAVANLVPGDVNFDGKVDINDLTLIANNWLTNNSSHLGAGDANGDGKVDINDLTLLANNWLKNPPALPTTPNPGGDGGSVSPSVVPEPSSLLLLGIGAVSMAFVARRRARRCE